MFCCQAGPGIENAFGAVAQCYSEGVPLVVIPGGANRSGSWIKPGFNAALNFQHITKHAETINTPDQIVPALRRAFSIAKNGRPGPVLIEVPGDMWNVEVAGELNYKPTRRCVTAPDPKVVDAAAAALINAKMPLIYAGQGVHYAKAWNELKAVAELLEAPVTTSLEGKSAFPETHPLSLGSGGVAMPRTVAAHVEESDVVFGAGASFTATGFGIRFPTKNKTFIHNTIDAMDIDKNIPTEFPLVGDSKLTLAALHDALKDRLKKPRGLTKAVQARIAEQNKPWWAEWMPRLTSEAKPLSPYRVIWDLMHIADVPNTIITHDAGSPRDELSPFWKPVTPLSYIGWGKSTQLGYGLGLAMGAKLAHPGEALHEHVGRRGHRHDRHGSGDLRARQDPDHVDPVQQLRDGDGIRCDEALAREVQVDGHLGQLRRLGEGARRVQRARHRPEPGRARDRERHQGDAGRQAGAARVHHDAGQDLLDLPGRLPGRSLIG